jgi:ATP-dependent RNA helicase DDX24/MAK5
MTAQGSGKTLAYGMPILNNIVARLLSSASEDAGLSALILAPTRELALQVKAHLTDVVRAACDPDSDEGHLPVNVVAITGGMSIQKQKRILALGKGGRPDILVATPGRLWDLIEQDRSLAKAIKRVRYLVPRRGRSHGRGRPLCRARWHRRPRDPTKVRENLVCTAGVAV